MDSLRMYQINKIIHIHKEMILVYEPHSDWMLKYSVICSSRFWVIPVRNVETSHGIQVLEECMTQKIQNCKENNLICALNIIGM